MALTTLMMYPPNDLLINVTEAVAIADAEPQRGDAPLNVNFSSQDSYDEDGTITEYRWDFDTEEKTYSYEENPSFTYDKPGSYNVTLTLTDDDGAVSTDTLKITVDTPPPPPQVSITQHPEDPTY